MRLSRIDTVASTLSELPRLITGELPNEVTVENGYTIFENGNITDISFGVFFRMILYKESLVYLFLSREVFISTEIEHGDVKNVVDILQRAQRCNSIKVEPKTNRSLRTGKRFYSLVFHRLESQHSTSIGDNYAVTRTTSDACRSCGKQLNRHEIEADSRICDSCHEIFKIDCDMCGTETDKWSVHVMGGNGQTKVVCRECMDTACNCSVCGDIELRANLIPHETDRRKAMVCKACEKTLRYCITCGVILGKREKRECSQCQEWRGEIREYHSGYGRKNITTRCRLRVGFEIEKEDPIIQDVNTKILLKQTGWIVEQDSSLHEEIGFELVSPVYNLDDQIQILKGLKSVEQLIDANQSSRCGGHIHVSDSRRTPSKIVDEIRGYLPLLYSLYPRRIENCYCPAKFHKDYIPDYQLGNHRQAVNPKRETLEFRIFPSPKNVGQAEWRARLILHMLKTPAIEPIDAAHQLLDRKSELYELLRETIGDQTIRRKVADFAKLSDKYEFQELKIRGTAVEKIDKRRPERRSTRNADTIETIDMGRGPIPFVYFDPSPNYVNDQATREAHSRYVEWASNQGMYETDTTTRLSSSDSNNLDTSDFSPFDSHDDVDEDGNIF